MQLDENISSFYRHRIFRIRLLLSNRTNSNRYQFLELWTKTVLVTFDYSNGQNCGCQIPLTLVSKPNPAVQFFIFCCPYWRGRDSLSAM